MLFSSTSIILCARGTSVWNHRGGKAGDIYWVGLKNIIFILFLSWLHNIYFIFDILHDCMVVYKLFLSSFVRRVSTTVIE